jgi:HAMP domain-containing protein
MRQCKCALVLSPAQPPVQLRGRIPEVPGSIDVRRGPGTTLTWLPLERLREGTGGIAASRFSTRVEVESGDEFEELAASFNEMADRLGRQFDALSALTEIQSAVLAAGDKAEIATAVLSRLERLLPHRQAVLTVLASPGLEDAVNFVGSSGELGVAEMVTLRPEGLWWAEGESDLRTVRAPDSVAPFLASLERGGYKVVMLPIFVDGVLGAILSASVWESSRLLEHELDPLRQLGDQVAQALSKAALIEELEELSVGTLSALARTIDASSQWTLGHSERVAEMAVRIGEAMGLSKQELSTLERGALLHASWVFLRRSSTSPPDSPLKRWMRCDVTWRSVRGFSSRCQAWRIRCPWFGSTMNESTARAIRGGYTDPRSIRWRVYWRSPTSTMRCGRSGPTGARSK